MRHQHEGSAASRLLREDQVDDGASRLGIEIAGRLVRGQDDRIRGERPCDRDALLLAARQLRGVMGQPRAEADGLEFFRSAFERVAAAGELQRNRDILERRHRRNELERLEDNADLFSTKARQRVFVEAGEVAVVDQDLAAVRPLQSGERHEQGGFARPGGADESDRLTACYGQADLLQDVDARRARAEGEIDLFELDDWLLHKRALPMKCRTDAARTRDRERRTYAGTRPNSRHEALTRVARGAFFALAVLWGASPVKAELLRVVAFGDSLSAGFQLPANAAFPAVLESRLRRDGYDVRVVNASISGDTTQGGLARLAYALKDGADLLILELGANDMLRGFDPKITRDNLEKIIDSCRSRGVAVLLAGMIAHANFGPDHKKAFDAIYPDLAREKGLPLYPFFLAGLFDDKASLSIDGLHPSAAGVERIVAGIAPLVEQSLDVIKLDRQKGATAR